MVSPRNSTLYFKNTVEFGVNGWIYSLALPRNGQKVYLLLLSFEKLIPVDWYITGRNGLLKVMINNTDYFLPIETVRVFFKALMYTVISFTANDKEGETHAVGLSIPNGHFQAKE